MVILINNFIRDHLVEIQCKVDRGEDYPKDEYCMLLLMTLYGLV